MSGHRIRSLGSFRGDGNRDAGLEPLELGLRRVEVNNGQQRTLPQPACSRPVQHWVDRLEARARALLDLVTLPVVSRLVRAIELDPPPPELNVRLVTPTGRNLTIIESLYSREAMCLIGEDSSPAGVRARLGSPRRTPTR